MLISLLLPVGSSFIKQGKITGFSEKGDRIKIINQSGNGLHGITKIEPAMVNPKFGISNYNKDPFEKPKCLIGACERIENNFWLYELNQNGNLRKEENKDYALYVYIAPKELSPEDETVLRDSIGSENETHPYHQSAEMKDHPAQYGTVREKSSI